MINFYLSIMRYFIQEVHLRTCLISKILFVNSSNLFLCFISSGRLVTPSKRHQSAIKAQSLCHYHAIIMPFTKIKVIARHLYAIIATLYRHFSATIVPLIRNSCAIYLDQSYFKKIIILTFP